MNEAFGHFIAARAFNDPNEADCSFSYYKTSIDERGVSRPPPQNTSCTGTPRWLDTQCPGDAELGGTELDWLTFYYDATRGPDALTLPLLAESFRRACSGSALGECTRQHVYFNRMPKANHGREQPAMSLADAYCATLLAHGEAACATSPRYVRFLSEAAAHGIDH